MKGKWGTFLEATVLAMLGAWGGAGCLISAFSLPLAHPNGVMALWLCWALVCAGLQLYRFGQATALTLAAAGAGWLWYQGSFGPQLLGTLGTIAQAYDAAYSWGIPAALQAGQTNTDLPVTVLGMGLILAITGGVCRRRGTAPAVLLLLLPLGACLVVTDTVPSEGYLFALLLCLCLLLLSDGVRRESSAQAGRLTLIAALPLALALGLLLHLCPRTGYVNTTQALREELLTTLGSLPGKLQTQGLDWLTGLQKRETVELSRLPAQLRLGIPAAEVTAEQSGPVYLRAQDYDVYTGTAWESTPDRQDSLAGTGAERGTVTVTTLNPQTSLLLPAFPQGQTFLMDGAAENEENRHSHTYTLRGASMGAFPDERWLKLPEQTTAQAKALLQGICPEGSTVEQTVAAVGDYVRASARYDRGGSSMGTQGQDFALWFLEEAEQGYCVHFATAAAVLLRSAGVPARYVTGYRVEALAGQTVKVTSDDAHAWVEYYDYRSWTWNILEATPAQELPAGTVPETTQATQPAPQTQPVTVPVTQPAPPTEPPVQEQPAFTLPRWIPVTVLWMLLGALALELQRLVRIGLRHKQQSRGTYNQQSVAIYRELQLLYRLRKQPVPEALSQLAEKAAFSQHRLTREEGESFTGSRAACRRALRTAPWWKRLCYRYWYAVI